MGNHISAMERTRRLAAAAACLIVGAASFALSYVALRDVAVEVEAVPAHLGFLVPIVVDGGVICGSAIIWSLSKSSGRRPVFPFLFVAALVAISVVINTAHAGAGWLSKGIAALPPLILLGTLELVASQGRRLEQTRALQATEAAAAAEAEAKLEAARLEAARLEAARAEAARVEAARIDAARVEAAHVAAARAETAGSGAATASPARTSPALSAGPQRPATAFSASPHAAAEPAAPLSEESFDDIDVELQSMVSPARSRTTSARKPLRVRAEEPLH